MDDASTFALITVGMAFAAAVGLQVGRLRSPRPQELRDAADQIRAGPNALPDGVLAKAMESATAALKSVESGGCRCPKMGGRLWAFRLVDGPCTSKSIMPPS